MSLTVGGSSINSSFFFAETFHSISSRLMLITGDGAADRGHDRGQDEGDQHAHGQEAELLGC